MEGIIKVSYTVMCKNDVSNEVSLADILANDKVMKAIKSEFASGLRNLSLSQKTPQGHVLGSSGQDTTVCIKTQKEVFEFSVSKDDFADLLEFAEEDARKHKRFKKECDGVAIVDIETVK